MKMDDPLKQPDTKAKNTLESRKRNSPIASLSKECAIKYQSVLEALRSVTTDHAAKNNFDRDTILITTQDARSRFKSWGNSIAAFQEIHLKSSLDSRLEHADEIRSRILKVLENLKESLEDEQINETWGPLSDSDEDEVGSQDPVQETTELDQLFTAIQDANSSLLKLSIVIRNSPARDDYLKAASRYRFDPHYDISHVREKHWSENKKSEWLIERLGKGITRRRAFLRYREEHHGKLTSDWDELRGVEDEKPDGTVAITKYTKATTFIDSKTPVNKEGSEPGSFGSQTSYEQTIVGEGSENRLNVPPPPVFAFDNLPFEYGQPFQCPLCYTEQRVKNKAAWKKHVFRDLKPYVCTFDCNLKMFRSRNEWFAHELQCHRREWTCHVCQKVYNKKSSFSKHITSDHGVNLGGNQLEALILQSEKPVDKFSASACLICDEWRTTLENPKHDAKRLFLNNGKEVEPYGTLSQFRRHLGRHMEQLALFALPKAEGDEMEDGSNDSEDSGEEHPPAVEHDTCDSEGCTSWRVLGRLFCFTHCCYFESCLEERKMEGSYVCENHHCQFDYCTLPITLGSIEFCENHIHIGSMRKDFEKSQGPIISQDESPDNGKVAVEPMFDASGAHHEKPSERNDVLGDLKTDSSTSPEDFLEYDMTDKPSNLLPNVRKKGDFQNTDEGEVEKAKQKPIKFKDAIGRNFHFPFRLCAKWTDMEKLILQAFEHIETIGPAVQEGHYDLVGPNGEVILPKMWDTIIEPDWAITMHLWPIPPGYQFNNLTPGENLEDSPNPETSLPPESTLRPHRGARLGGQKGQRSQRDFLRSLEDRSLEEGFFNQSQWQ